MTFTGPISQSDEDWRASQAERAPKLHGADALKVLERCQLFAAHGASTIRLICSLGAFDFDVWEGAIGHRTWYLLHSAERPALKESLLEDWRCSMPAPFSAVEDNLGENRRFVVITTLGSRLVLYCTSGPVPQPLHHALVRAWSHSQGDSDERHRQDLRQPPEAAGGLEPGEGREHGEGPGSGLVQAAEPAGAGDRQVATAGSE